MLPTLQKGEQRPEFMLSAPLGKHRMLAKYDLLQYQEEEHRYTIWDWKTSPVRPKRARLEQRMQTRIYPFMLVAAGKSLNSGNVVLPDNIEMIYWFADHPDQPEHFSYNEKLYKRDERHLMGLLRELESMRADQFVKTSEEQKCRFCVYRSLCERGTQAGLFTELDQELEEDIQIDLDFDQIAEISF